MPTGSTSHTPAETWHDGPFDLPNDGGDPWQYSSILKDGGAAKGLIAKLFDRSQWLRGVYDALATGVTALSTTVSTHTSQLAALVAGTLAVASVKLSSQSITRHVVAWFVGPPDLLGAAQWFVLSNGRPAQILAGASVFFQLDVPHGATLTAVSIAVAPDNTHGTMTGVTRPMLEVLKIDASGAETLVGSQMDPNIILASYQAAHTISVTGLSEAINRSTCTYVAALRGEDGANFKTGFAAGPVAFTFTTAALDNGAG